MELQDIPVGSRVRITQHLYAPGRADPAAGFPVEGRLIDAYVEARSPLRNDFANSESHEYPLARLKLRKDNGELDVLVIDQRTSVEILRPAVRGPAGY